jgi:hypothetical protein
LLLSGLEAVEMREPWLYFFQYLEVLGVEGKLRHGFENTDGIFRSGILKDVCEIRKGDGFNGET